jgi:MoxR-like ATPase
MVLATQNPIEMAGTYPLPEAQLDRFLLKVDVGYPSVAELVAILGRTTGAEPPAVEVVADGDVVRRMAAMVREVPVASTVADYTARLVIATQPGGEGAPEVVERFVRYGASPRGAQALILGAKVTALLAGRANVALADVRAIAPAALSHRVLINFEGQAEGIDAARIIASVLEVVSPD